LKDGDEEIFDRAGVPELSDDYPYEVGFSFTDPSSRGKGYNTKLKKALFAKVHNRGIYATIRVNNVASITVNKKLGFKTVGEPYSGIVTDVQLMVYK
jgi:RimJ/RimL family protein N-acetyltransferase